MPSLDQLTARLEATCEKIQDSIITESLTGGEEAFTSNFQDTVLNFASLETWVAEWRTSTIMDFLTEYKKMLTN